MRAWLVVLAGGAVIAGCMALTLTRAKAAGVVVFCGEFKAMAGRLDKRFGEKPVAQGQVSPDQMLVVFARPDGKTFTALRVGTTGKACIVTSGANWEGFSKPGEAL